jgi:hypothetical protein
MLIQLLIEHPQALGPVLQNTPKWVFGLFAALLALGLSQIRTREVSLMRMTLLPVIMTGLSLWGTLSAFRNSSQFTGVMMVWALGALLMLALLASRDPQAGAAWHADTSSFHIPGSWVPLLLILGIFLTKYIVGVDLAMQPALAQDGTYSLIVGGLYGVFSGVFFGRSARLWRLAFRAVSPRAGSAVNA